MTQPAEPRLQPLRIPNGWRVEFNDLREVEPIFNTYDDTSWFFREDLLLLHNVHWNLMIDLGWYPDADATGTFALRLGLTMKSDYRNRGTSRCVKS